MENLINSVAKIGEAVGVPLLKSELRDIYRLPGKSYGTSPRPIVAEFTTMPTKQAFLAAARAYNRGKGKDDILNTATIGVPGERLPVYVVEHLPTSSKKLFHLSREFAKKNGYKYCWISNGNIFLRKQEGEKQVFVKSEECLVTISK